MYSGIAYNNSFKGALKNKHDAEDILQNVFYKIHNSIYQLKDTDKLQAWIYQITRNAIIDYYRRKEIVMESTELPEEESADGSTNPNAMPKSLHVLNP
jgi:DNA-directed RNA polymerase specialized sigma subunit, sigma24 homolog